MHFEAMIKRVWRYNWKPGLSEIRDEFAGRDLARLEMHWEAVIERVCRCTGRL
jgi:hypothetical protein